MWFRRECDISIHMYTIVFLYYYFNVFGFFHFWVIWNLLFDLRNWSTLAFSVVPDHLSNSPNSWQFFCLSFLIPEITAVHYNVWLLLPSLLANLTADERNWIQGFIHARQLPPLSYNPTTSLGSKLLSINFYYIYLRCLTLYFVPSYAF